LQVVGVVADNINSLGSTAVGTPCQTAAHMRIIDRYRDQARLMWEWRASRLALGRRILLSYLAAMLALLMAWAYFWPQTDDGDAIMHYLRSFNLPAVDGQVIFRKALAQWAELHPLPGEGLPFVRAPMLADGAARPRLDPRARPEFGLRVMV